MREVDGPIVGGVTSALADEDDLAVYRREELALEEGYP
jgi:hypothetical protein